MPETVATTIVRRELMPTGLSSSEIRERIPAGIRQRALYSARTTELSVLQRIQQVCRDLAAGETNLGKAREGILSALDEVGYDPVERGDTGMRDRSSERRLNLILRTQRQMAAGATMAQEPATARALYPCWQLERYGSRSRPRTDWLERWHSAGASVGWEGALRGTRMIARKDSPIWQALGDGVGGFGDTLGNPYPPFAYGSGLAWTPISADLAERLGLGGDPPAAQQASLTPGEQEIADAARELGVTMEDLV